MAVSVLTAVSGGVSLSGFKTKGNHLSSAFIPFVCVINRFDRPKSGYGGKWDPSK